MRNPLNTEPVAIVNVVRLGLLAAGTFGLALTPAQLMATMTLLEAVLTLFTRAQVTSAQGLADLKPQTLKQAQQTSEPVADVVKKLP
jgi:hypothetical protein